MTNKKSIFLIGDVMKKIIAVILLAIASGISFSLFIFSKYEECEISGTKIYYAEQGVYSNYSNMLKNTDKLEKYAYEKLDKKYHVYVCFTTKEENMRKLEEYFKSLNYNITFKEKETDNISFYNTISEYDYLISSVTNLETIKNICKQLVKKYEENK